MTDKWPGVIENAGTDRYRIRNAREAPGPARVRAGPPCIGRQKTLEAHAGQFEHRESERLPAPWLDVKAAAVYVGFCEKTIRRACAIGGLRHVRMGRSIRIQRAWLDAWLMSQSD